MSKERLERYVAEAARVLQQRADVYSVEAYQRDGRERLAVCRGLYGIDVFSGPGADLSGVTDDTLRRAANNAVAMLTRAMEGRLQTTPTYFPALLGMVYVRTKLDTERRTSPDLLRDLDAFCSLLEQHAIKVGHVDQYGANLSMVFPSGHHVRLVAVAANGSPAALVPDVLEVPPEGQQADLVAVDEDHMAAWIVDHLREEGTAATAADVMRVLELEDEYQLGLLNGTIKEPGEGGE